MIKEKKKDLTFEKFMRVEKPNIEQCEQFGDMTDASVEFCNMHNCKQREVCEMRTKEKLNVLFGKTKELDKFK